MLATSIGHAQSRRREDLLDDLTTHIQICAEITDNQSRLACYDKLQTKVGDVQPQGSNAAPTPTPLAPRPATQPPSPPASPSGTAAVGGGQNLSGTPLAPPLYVPGGGTATLGSGGPGTAQPTPIGRDPDAAFDPRRSSSSSQPAGVPGPKPQPQVRRTGPRPIPNFATQQPLVSLAANNLTYGDSRYWQVTITITSNTPRPLETQVRCVFLNAGQSVGDAYFGPTSIAAGEQISTELIGPPTTTYVDSTNCRVLSP